MTAPAAPGAAVLPLRAADYQSHAVHCPGSAWVEKNCYIDVWIEAVHALGLEPLAMLPFTVRLDFEGDQWTFFKPPHRDLERLYGIVVHELNPWRGDIVLHAEAQARQGRLVFTEADAFWLPDTAGTDYRQQHTKTTIVVNALDRTAETLGYFHNAGYHELQGEDFRRLFRTDVPPDPAFMPFYAEFARIDRLKRLPAPELAALSTELLAEHLAYVPATNPVERFAAQFPADVAWLQAEGLPLYHGYAFATLRQLGANFELCARGIGWMAAQHAGGDKAALAEAEAAFDEISGGAKAMVLKTARAVHGGRATDFAPLLQGMADAWTRGMQALRTAVV
ncbi:DUF1839 family protein [uncultured Xylophilus sp.]|uniref:DUF1839 family protein n=1 Tax=uncultured Xylophilus sp. TaxID=296832 RepID=UPI0025F91995|nr:DUF1839 family protein [uncultured Xylophilus sp.]